MDQEKSLIMAIDRLLPTLPRLQVMDNLHTIVWQGSPDDWYPETGSIRQSKGDAYDANPVHIIHEVLVGIGVPISSIDDESFRNAADKAFDEGRGLSILWPKDQHPLQFMTTVLLHANGVVIPKDGLIAIELFEQPAVQ